MSISQLIAELRTAIGESGPHNTQSLTDLKQALAKHGDKAVMQLGVLLTDRNSLISEAAAEVLQLIASERAYDELVGYALRHLDDPTGKTKLPGHGWRLLRMLGKTILPAMHRAYCVEQSFETRLSMIHIVQLINDPAGVPLLDIGLTDSDSRLVEAAAEALGRVGDQLAYERLVRLLGSDNVQYRIGAIRGLKCLGNPAAVEPLLGVLLEKDEPLVRWGPSRGAEAETTLHQAAAKAIDILTGEQLGGQVARIRCWIEQYLPH